MIVKMSCGGCSKQFEIANSPEWHSAGYAYTDNAFFQMMIDMGMHEVEDGFEEMPCPDCGHAWHFLGQHPVLEKVAHA
jgi:hypothetical protein